VTNYHLKMISRLVSDLLKREGGDQLPPEDDQQVSLRPVEEGGRGPTTA
jgi:hypothetical protein